MCYRREKEQFSADCYGNIASFHADVLRCEIYEFRWNRSKIQWFFMVQNLWSHFAIWRFCINPSLQTRATLLNVKLREPSKQQELSRKHNHILSSPSLFCQFWLKRSGEQLKPFWFSCLLSAVTFQRRGIVFEFQFDCAPSNTQATSQFSSCANTFLSMKHLQSCVLWLSNTILSLGSLRTWHDCLYELVWCATFFSWKCLK